MSTSGFCNTWDTWTSWRKYNEGPLRWWRGRSISPVRKGWELGLLTLEKRRLREDFIDVYKCLTKGCKEGGASLFLLVPSSRKRGNGHQPKHGRILLTVRRHSLLWRWPGPGTSCPEWLRHLHPWGYSKAMWTWAWASSSRWQWHWSRWPLKVSSHFSHSVILWFQPNILYLHTWIESSVLSKNSNRFQRHYIFLSSCYLTMKKTFFFKLILSLWFWRVVENSFKRAMTTH